MFDIQKQMEGILWDGVLHTGSGSALLVNIFCHLETHWTLGIFYSNIQTQILQKQIKMQHYSILFFMGNS